MLILFAAAAQEGHFTTDGGAVAGGHSVSHRYQQRRYVPSGGGFGGGHASQRRFFLTEIVTDGGGVGGGHSVHRSRRSFSTSGGAVAGGKQKSPRTRRFHSTGGAVAGGHVSMTFIGASANMRELQLEGNAEAMLKLAAVLEGEGFRVVMKSDFLGFWLWFDTTGIVIYFDLVDRGLMRLRQAINSGTDAVPIWSYGTPVYLFLNYWYDSAGWLFFTTKYIYIVARHDRANQTPYDCVFAGAANSPTGQLDGCLVLVGGSTTTTINLMPLTTTAIVAAGITMNKATLAGQSVVHLKSLSSYFGAGKNGNSSGQGVTATEIIVCDSTSQVKGSLPNARSTQGANLQTEQIIKTPSSRWLCFQNNNTSVILQR